jgi:colanic acid/amylovoran biosynthesis glycosyltransferase
MNDKGYILYLLSFISTYVHGEINELLRRGINVQILLLGNSPRSLMWKKITKLNNRGNKLPGNPIINNLAELNGCDSYDSAAEKIAKLLKDTTVDRIHAHFAKREAQIGLQLSKILGIPFSVTTHANDIFVPLNVSELQYLLRESPQLFTISKFNKKYLEKYIPEKHARNIKVTYLGIDIDNLPKREITNKNYFSIYCVASGLVEKKGVKYLIKACEFVKQKGFRFKCSIVGSDPDGKILDQSRKEIKKLGLAEEINFPGILPSDEVLANVAKCDVFVLPCIKSENGDMDGIPVSLIEAMGIGVPVVSTAVSGIPELITNKVNGLLVAQKDPMSIAEAIINICENPEVSKKMGGAARKTVKNKFSIKKYVDSLIYNWNLD